jgi:filamentous hemagglutinin family protein
MKPMRLVLLVSASFSSMAAAQNTVQVPYAAPTVIAGQATFNVDQTGTVRTVTQSTAKAFLDWTALDVPLDHTLRFEQPNAEAITLNRVTGGNQSVIDGLIEANGQVWILNPNGVFISPSGRVVTPGFLASTGNISPGEFMNAGTQFAIGGNSPASVINAGTITSSLGYTVLNAAQVQNSGLIAADRGAVLIAAVDNLSVSFDQGRLISYALSNNASAPAAIREITNTGTIAARGGLVALSMASALGTISGVINTTGLIDASAVRDEGGTIVLDGGSTGLVVAGGRLDVSGKGEGQTGGSIAVLGSAVLVASGALLDASGSAGGGKINVGGGWQGASINGQGSAVLAGVASGATLDASALISGDGGEVTLWSDVANPLSQTFAHGTFLARGGAYGGNGGRIETSGRYLETTGVTGSASAPHGAAGIWLFDPYDIEVVSGSGDGPNIVNPAFTQGLLGWSAYNGGSGSVVTSVSAANGTFSPPADSSGSFALVSAGQVNVQTGIQQTFTAESGQSITLYAIFVGNDYLPFNDNGGVSIVKPDGTVDTLFFGSVEQFGDYNASGFSTINYTFSASGEYTIRSFATNVLDSTLNSQLGFSLLSGALASINGGFSNIGGVQVWTPTASASKIDVSQITGLLNGGTSVQIATGAIGSVGGDAGNITINATINKTAGGDATLQLDAANAIFVNQAIGSSSGLLNVTLNAGSGGIALNNTVNTNGGTLTLNTTGATSQNSALTTATLSLLGTGGAHVLNHTGNSFVTLSGNTGSVVVHNNNATSVSGLRTSGQLNLSTPGAITIQGTNKFGPNSVLATPHSITLLAGSNTTIAGAVAFQAGNSFKNEAGPGAFATIDSGYWLIYSEDPSLNTFGGLASGNAAIWNQTPDSLSPSAIAPGNRYIFKLSPMLTVSASDTKKIYGNALLSGSLPFTVTGLIDASAFGNVFTQDSVSGAPALTSSGAASTANVGQYAINAALGSLTRPAGYGISFVSGTLTVDPRPLVASLTGTVSRNYDGTTAALLGSSNFALEGLVSGETITVSQTAGIYASANAGSNLLVTAALASGNFTAGTGTLLSNYVLPTSASGTIGTIVPLTLTYVADPALRFVGASNPTFTGSVTGFLPGEDLATATTGQLVFTSPATATSEAGRYPINGSGLSAINYIFVQAAENASALTIQPNIVSQVSNVSSQVPGIGTGSGAGSTPPPPPPSPAPTAPSGSDAGSSSGSGTGSGADSSSSSQDGGDGTGGDSSSSPSSSQSSEGASGTEPSTGAAPAASGDASGEGGGQGGGAGEGDEGATSGSQSSQNVVQVEIEAADPLPPSPISDEPTSTPSDPEDSSDPVLAAASGEAANDTGPEQDIVEITQSITVLPPRQTQNIQQTPEGPLSINVSLAL